MDFKQKVTQATLLNTQITLQNVVLKKQLADVKKQAEAKPAGPRQFELDKREALIVRLGKELEVKERMIENRETDISILRVQKEALVKSSGARGQKDQSYENMMCIKINGTDVNLLSQNILLAVIGLLIGVNLIF